MCSGELDGRATRGYVKYLVLLFSLFILAGCAIQQPETVSIESLLPVQPSTADETAAPAIAEGNASTIVATVAPWVPDGLAAGYTVRDQASGSCWVGSLAANRPDAWRCSAPQGEIDEILDPCLANPYDADSPLACLHADDSVTLLTLTEPLPQAFANSTVSESLPLMVRLDNGDECLLATGATTTVDLGQGDERVNFFCDSGAVLIGIPDRAGAIWTIKVAADPGNLTDFQVVGIAEASVFRGDTGTVGWSSHSPTAGTLMDVSVEERAGAHRVTFDFGGVTMPDYEIGYTNEPVHDENGNVIAFDGDHFLRLWFRYPQPESPDSGVAERVEPVREAHFNEAVLARAIDGNLLFYLGLDERAGFEVTRNEDDTVSPSISTSRMPV